MRPSFLQLVGRLSYVKNCRVRFVAFTLSLWLCETFVVTVCRFSNVGPELFLL